MNEGECRIALFVKVETGEMRAHGLVAQIYDCSITLKRIVLRNCRNRNNACFYSFFKIIEREIVIRIAQRQGVLRWLRVRVLLINKNFVMNFAMLNMN